MPKSVSYVTKVREITGVELVGPLVMSDHNDRDVIAHWHIGADCLDEWLEKFDSKHVYLSLRTHEKDESHLLPASEEAQG